MHRVFFVYKNIRTKYIVSTHYTYRNTLFMCSCLFTALINFKWLDAHVELTQWHTFRKCMWTNTKCKHFPIKIGNEKKKWCHWKIHRDEMQYQAQEKLNNLERKQLQKFIIWVSSSRSDVIPNQNIYILCCVSRAKNRDARKGKKVDWNAGTHSGQGDWEENYCF